MVQVVEFLSCKCKAQSSVPSNAPKKVQSWIEYTFSIYVKLYGILNGMVVQDIHGRSVSTSKSS
jgi:hypothetical protein